MLISAAVTFMGPFGTFTSLPLGERAAFWFGLIGAAIAIGLAIRAALRTFLPGRGDWTETMIFAPLLTLAFTPILYAVVAWMSDGNSAMSAFEMALVVFCTPLGVVAARRILAGRPPEILAPSRAADPRILQRLPEEWGKKILRITVRDHYVEIVTDRTKEKVLMRFSDAISEADGIPGLQVHRSHWVAEDAVRAVECEKGRMFLTLEDGSRIPVSRGFRTAVVEAGIGKDAA